MTVNLIPNLPIIPALFTKKRWIFYGILSIRIGLLIISNKVRRFFTKETFKRSHIYLLPKKTPESRIAGGKPGPLSSRGHANGGSLEVFYSHYLSDPIFIIEVFFYLSSIILLNIKVNRILKLCLTKCRDNVSENSLACNDDFT